MVTRKEGRGWSDVCNWVLRALVHAEAKNVTQDNAAHGLRGNVSFVAALETVGNYGEIYARHMEEVVPRSSMNLLYDVARAKHSGLHYSHPFGSIDTPYHEFDSLGTIHRIIERGKLMCGVFGSEDRSIDADYCRFLAASLFDSDTSLVDLVVLSNDDNFTDMVDSGDVDVIAGVILNFGNDIMPSNQTESGVTGLSFSKPYFYGGSGLAPRAMATSQLDTDW